MQADMPVSTIQQASVLGVAIGVAIPKQVTSLIHLKHE